MKTHVFIDFLRIRGAKIQVIRPLEVNPPVHGPHSLLQIADASSQNTTWSTQDTGMKAYKEVIKCKDTRILGTQEQDSNDAPQPGCTSIEGPADDGILHQSTWVDE